MINILFLFCCLVTSSTSQRVDGMQGWQEDLTPVKSIQKEFGHVVDCIDINKQPAFDHPLLKNHKLQEKPSNPKMIGKSNLRNSLLGLESPCPKGTVPIRRTTKNEFIHAKSLLNNDTLASAPAPTSTPQGLGKGDHVAEVHLKPQRTYYGVNGVVSIWNPEVEMDQSSAALVWARHGDNEIAVGWHVAPQLYNGDFGTHFFAQWTVDSYNKIVCYNLLCPGYVQTDQRYYLGARFVNTSLLHGEIYEVQFGIYQDSVTKNWWLNVDNTEIGYFPADLFTNMTSAQQVGWGGRTTTTPGTSSPPMGSGRFPDKNLQSSCHFRYVTFKDKAHQDQKPEENLAQAFTDKSDCYGAQFFGYQKDTGSILEFGGPGGQCKGASIEGQAWATTPPIILFLLPIIYLFI